MLVPIYRVLPFNALIGSYTREEPENNGEATANYSLRPVGHRG